MTSGLIKKLIAKFQIRHFGHSAWTQKVLRSLMAVSMGWVLAHGAWANASDEKVSSLLYNCNLSFHASGKSIYLGLGYTDVEGTGALSCYDFLTGATERIPLKVKMRGVGAGLGVTGLSISGGALGLGLTTGPESLLGRYTVVRGNVAVGVGVGVSSGLRFSKGAVTLSASIDGQTGLGAGVDINFLELSRAGQTELVDQAPKEPRVIAAAAVAAAAKRQEENHEPPKPPVVEHSAVVVKEVHVVAAPQVVQPQVIKPIPVQVGQSIAVVDGEGHVLKVFTIR